MKNCISTGDILALTAPGGGVVSGVTVLIGSLVVIPIVTAAATEEFNASHSGVFTVPFATADTPAEGDLAYWDNGAGEWTTVAGANTFGGWFVSAEIGTSDTANVKLGGATA